MEHANISHQLGSFILEVYEKSRQLHPSAYKPWLFDAWGRYFTYNNGLWLSVSPEAEPVGVYLHKLPAQLIPEYLSTYQEQDVFLEHIIASEGKSIRGEDILPDDVVWNSDIQKEFYNKYDMVRTVSFSKQDSGANMTSNIYFSRAAFGDRFTSHECQLLDFIMPHFVEGAFHNLKFFLDGLGSQGPSHASAICDRSGTIHLQQTAFQDLLSEEWQKPSAKRLPKLCLPKSEAPEQGITPLYEGRRIRIEYEPLYDLVVVHAHRRDPLERLSAKEREIAALVQDSLTNKEIGKRLGISPKTVSIHLGNIFQKLGINRRQQLSQTLR